MQEVSCPGFFDLQVNGFAGVDFNHRDTTDADVERGLEAMASTGVTRCLPTLITSSLDSFTRCARVLSSLRHPMIAGLHMEGPYIARDARGAHAPEHIVPASFEDFARRQEAARGSIVLVTLAPEVPGALALTERLVSSGVRVAIGHSAATPVQIRDAIRAGATMSTHLGNGAQATLPRHPNLLWEQLGADELVAGFIVDGHHLSPYTTKSMIRAKTPSRSILVTDAVAAASQPPGLYSIGHLEIERRLEGRVVLRGTNALAGSALTLDRAVENTVRFTGLPIATVLAMASEQPARYLGISPAGRICASWDEATCRLYVDRVDP